MKEFASALLSILWRSVLFFPLALAFFFLVLTYLLAPFELLLYAFFVSPWYGLVLPVWAVSVYLLRNPLRNYFKDLGSSWL